MTNDRVGLAVMRIQPLHLGHCITINRMIQECKTAILCIGSSQLSGERHDPFTVNQRINMLKNVYRNRLKIIPLNDIGAANPAQWVEYIEEKIRKMDMDLPTDYYTGSRADAEWYRQHFHNEELDPFNLSDEELLSSSLQPRMLHYYRDGIYKKLHIVHRDNNDVPSATEIRTWLETRADGWQEWTPAVNHDIIKEYPEHLKVPLD